MPSLAWSAPSQRASIFEEWAQSTGLRVGSWHVAIAQYWIAVQQIARQGYDQYLQTAPLERDIVMVEGA